MKFPKLIIAASDSCADLLYATGFSTPDPYVFLQRSGRSSIILNDLEYDRGCRDAKVDVVLSLSELGRKLRGRRRKPLALPSLVAAWLLDQGIRAVQVPHDFPAGLAAALLHEGVRVHPVDGHFWPEREIKSAAELQEMKTILETTESAMQRAFDILKASKIRKSGELVFRSSVLTSEVLRAEVESVVLQGGGTAMNNSIIACGNQACDPHERGHGPLRAHELIIIDIFPRSASTGFFGDLTRTVVRGRASDSQRTLWEVCLTGQKRAIKALKPGADGAQIQSATRDFFTKSGYPTEQRDGRWCGFFHGLGHGLGLDLHELPRLGSSVLKIGQVFTVEPGIYIPGLGGVRHEDVAVITKTGGNLMSQIDKPFEL